MLEVEEGIDRQPGEDVQVESSGAQLKEVPNDAAVCINFKIYERGIWKQASAPTIDRLDPSKIEKVAKIWIQGRWRMFTTNLRMLAPQQCQDAVIADETYTILLIRESEINIDYELLSSAIRGRQIAQFAHRC